LFALIQRGARSKEEINGFNIGLSLETSVKNCCIETASQRKFTIDHLSIALRDTRMYFMILVQS
jgi:hypothetical protein